MRGVRRVCGEGWWGMGGRVRVRVGWGRGPLQRRTASAEDRFIGGPLQRRTASAEGRAIEDRLRGGPIQRRAASCRTVSSNAGPHQQGMRGSSRADVLVACMACMTGLRSSQVLGLGASEQQHHLTHDEIFSGEPLIGKAPEVRRGRRHHHHPPTPHQHHRHHHNHHHNRPLERQRTNLVRGAHICVSERRCRGKGGRVRERGGVMGFGVGLGVGHRV